MTPDEEVAQVLDAVAQMRARHAAFNVASLGIRGDQFHPDVQARWDTEGNLTGIDIAPNALRDYTNLELEDIISDVLRRTRLDVGRSSRPCSTGIWDLTPEFDPEILGVPMSPLLRNIAGS